MGRGVAYIPEEREVGGGGATVALNTFFKE